ncbi:MAG: hypothetical protein ACLTMD_08455 [Clostridium sp.]
MKYRHYAPRAELALVASGYGTHDRKGKGTGSREAKAGPGGDHLHRRSRRLSGRPGTEHRLPERPCIHAHNLYGCCGISMTARWTVFFPRAFPRTSWARPS